MMIILEKHHHSSIIWLVFTDRITVCRQISNRLSACIDALVGMHHQIKIMADTDKPILNVHCLFIIIQLLIQTTYIFMGGKWKIKYQKLWQKSIIHVVWSRFNPI